MILRAQVVLPVIQPPLENGAVRISGDRITAVGSWGELKPEEQEEVVDLGDALVLPGLINSHCHLDYTGMAGLLPPPKSFTDWITSLISLKAAWSYADFADSWLRGARMLLESGVTTVADIEAVPELLPEAWSGTPLRVISFLELISVKSRFAVKEIIGNADRFLSGLPHGSGRIGLSPHAAYSTAPALLQQSADLARSKNWPVTTHLGESAEEFEMFQHARGPMFDWLKKQRDMGDCGGTSPVQLMDQAGLLQENFLAVHLNYPAEPDARLLAQRGASVVHCPRSHDYFGHQSFPLAALQAEGLNIALGTDSLASVRKSREEPLALTMFSEMRQMASRFPELSAEKIVRMATLNGAKALGRAAELGEISPGALADLVILPLARRTENIYETVLQHRGRVLASMIGGQWALSPAT